MVDLTVQAPEVQQSLVDPRAGQYDERQGSALSGLAEGVRTFARYSADKADQKPDLSQFLYRLTDPEQVKEFTGLPEATNQDMADLKSAGGAAVKMDQLMQQSSPYRLGTAKRIALTRAYIAANPKFAPEFLEAFKLSQGQGLGQAVEGLEKDQNKEAEAQREYYMKTAREIGIDPSRTSYTDIQLAVNNHNDLIARSQRSSAELAIMRNDKDKTNLEVEGKFARDVLPGLVHGAIARYNSLLSDYDPRNPDLGKRQTILGNISHEISAFEENMLKSGMTDFASVKSMRDVLTAVNAATIDYLEGKTSLEAIQTSTNLLISAADNKLVHEPYMSTVFAIAQRMGDAGLSKFMARFDELGLNVKLGTLLSTAVNAATGGTDLPTGPTISEQMRNLSPQEKTKMYALASEAIKAIGSDGDEVSVQQARNAMYEYVKAVGVGENFNGKLFDTMLTALANPESVYLFTEEQPELKIAFSNYMADFTESLRRDLFTEMGTKVPVGEVQTGTAAGSYPIEEYSSNLIDMTIGPDGSLFFRAKGNLDPSVQPSINKLASDLNDRYSKRSKRLALALNAMGAGPLPFVTQATLEGQNIWRSHILSPEEMAAQ